MWSLGTRLSYSLLYNSDRHLPYGLKVTDNWPDEKFDDNGCFARFMHEEDAVAFIEKHLLSETAL